MNGPKKFPKKIYSLENNIDINEENEDYQVIKEDYCSSPKCGIKSKTVTKSVEKIIFSPLEISTNPYFKYYVTPVKDERFKYDFSQSETNHTRNHDEDKSKKSVNIIYSHFFYIISFIILSIFTTFSSSNSLSLIKFLKL